MATARQQRVARAAVELATGLPVLGIVPRLDAPAFSERHLGLLPPQENPRAREAIVSAANVAARHLDLEALWRLAHSRHMHPDGSVPSAASISENFGPENAGPANSGPPHRPITLSRPSPPVRIGYFCDAAFHFYYPENLEALERCGAALVPIDALRDHVLPAGLGALYIGGGFPEESAGALSANATLRHAVRQAAERGLPIYAECGGLMYLGRRIISRDGAHDMAGLFPVSFLVERRPQGHGYVEAAVESGHPFAPAGRRFKGHEFHYSKPVDWSEADIRFVLRLERGTGFCGGRDGLVHQHAFACYTHLHALGEPWWAPALVERARKFAQTQE